MDNAVARVIGGIYIALSDAIGPDAASIAHKKLARFAVNEDLPAEDRRIYGCIAHSASLTPEEAEAENAEFEAAVSRRPQLRVIQGGSAA